jgi:hypothetical protein
MSRGTRSAAAVAVGLACLSGSGCIFVSSDTTPAPHPNTLGRELRDLKGARDEGAVNDDEYRAAKERLLASAPKH